MRRVVITAALTLAAAAPAAAQQVAVGPVPVHIAPAQQATVVIPPCISRLHAVITIGNTGSDTETVRVSGDRTTTLRVAPASHGVLRLCANTTELGSITLCYRCDGGIVVSLTDRRPYLFAYVQYEPFEVVILP